MKKIYLTVLILTLFSGVSFAAFQVKNVPSEAVESVVVENLESAPEVAPAADSATDDNTALILAVVSVVLFPFALHNWYLGNTKKALWQSLMVFPGAFLLGIPALASWIWQLVDLIKML